MNKAEEMRQLVAERTQRHFSERPQIIAKWIINNRIGPAADSRKYEALYHFDDNEIDIADRIVQLLRDEGFTVSTWGADNMFATISWKQS